MELRRLLEEPAEEAHHLGHRHLGDAARVREGRVEDRDALRLRGGKVHLVRADAEAADRRERRGAVRALERICADLGLRPDAHHGGARECRTQLRAGKRTCRPLDGEARGDERRIGGRVHRLEQQRDW